MKKVALIIGHSAENGGAVNSVYGINEYQFNGPLAHSVYEKLLLEGFEPIVIYRDCPYSELPSKVNRTGASIAVSFHCNAFNEEPNGTETLYYYKSDRSKNLAHSIQKEIVACLGLKDRGVKPVRGAHQGKAGDRGGYLCQNTSMPCVIVEPFFIDSDSSLELAQHRFEELAEAYTKGIVNYLGVKKADPELPKVTGQVDFRVDVECPHCEKSINLISDNNCGHDYDNCVTNAFFDTKGESWDKAGIDVTCHHCEGEFILNKLEY